jgi:hypothetical protein
MRFRTDAKPIPRAPSPPRVTAYPRRVGQPRSKFSVATFRDDWNFVVFPLHALPAVNLLQFIALFLGIPYCGRLSLLRSNCYFAGDIRPFILVASPTVRQSGSLRSLLKSTIYSAMASDSSSEVADSPQKSTPASSPPPQTPTDVKMGDTGVSEAMLKEEERMRISREKEDAINEERLKGERQKDIDGGSETVDKKYKALEFLLSQSKVCESPQRLQIQQATKIAP